MTDFVGITVFQHTPQCAENPVLFNNPGNYLNPPAKPGAARLTGGPPGKAGQLRQRGIVRCAVIQFA